MEYCGGKTLKDLIEKGLYQNEDKVWCLFREILQGLNHIHEQGMIHRDLKPGNVLIDATGHAKIGDFGLATTRAIIVPTSGAAAAAAASVQETTTATMQSRDTSMNAADVVSTTAASGTSHMVDSAAAGGGSLSGAVGTALYVAPELLTPTKNRFIYTQVLD